MKVSTKGRYALRVMLDLAMHEGDGNISLKDVAERQGVSLKYLEMIISILNKSGFVTSQRGKSGGYQLAKKPEEYTAGSILKVMEGSLAPVGCLAGEESRCSRAAACLTLPMWKGLDKLIDDYLEGITLADLLEGNLNKKEPQEDAESVSTEGRSFV